MVAATVPPGQAGATGAAPNEAGAGGAAEEVHNPFSGRPKRDGKSKRKAGGPAGAGPGGRRLGHEGGAHLRAAVEAGCLARAAAAQLMPARPPPPPPSRDLAGQLGGHAQVAGAGPLAATQPGAGECGFPSCAHRRSRQTGGWSFPLHAWPGSPAAAKPTLFVCPVFLGSSSARSVSHLASALPRSSPRCLPRCWRGTR